MRRWLLAPLLAATAGCLVLHDEAGVPIDYAAAQTIRPGLTTRTEVLERLGPPTGPVQPNLFATMTRLGGPFEGPAAQGPLDERWFVWQRVEVVVQMGFVPVLFTWAEAELRTDSLCVSFDEQGIVRDITWRRDE